MASQEFKEGDRVVLVETKGEYDPPPGSAGVVLRQLNPGDDPYALVRWDGFKVGHGEGQNEWFTENWQLVLDGDYLRPPEVVEEEDDSLPLRPLSPGAKDVLTHLETRGSISPAEAFSTYGTLRLAARIHDLREWGHGIKTEMRSDARGHRYGRYTLVK